MSKTAISPHIAGLRLRPPWRSQHIGGRDVEIHINPTGACRQRRRRTGRGCTWLAGRSSRSEPDPIFALIEEYRRLCDEYGAVIDAQKSFAVDSPDWKKADDRISQTSTAYTATIRKLCQTAPTTLDGLVAVLSFVIDAEDQGDDLLNTFAEDKNEGSDAERKLCMRPFFRTVLRSVEQMARVQS